MKKSLLVIAHGSKREASNDEVRDLVCKIDEMKHEFYEVKAAFLELADPLIPDGIRDLILNGAEKVVVYPYFLSAGRHVVEDVPRDVDIVRKEYPNIDIVISSYLGSSKKIRDIILDQLDDI